jgi:prepilin-type processing-associated H-X9-DG protein
MPIRFSCPHCGNTTDVAEQYAGQSGPCARCGQTITVPPASGAPMQYNYYPPRKPRSTATTLLIVLAVCVPVVLFCGGILVALLLPAVQAAREAARRAACTNNLRQIYMAMEAYHVQNGHYPPAFVADKDGKPMHSWRVLLLPYLGEQGLYNQYDMNQPWDSPHNMALVSLMPSVYCCPSDGPATAGITSYAMLVGPNAISTGPAGRARNEITDSLSNTIMVAETTGGGVKWLDPQHELDIQTMSFDLSDNSGKEISSMHPTGANVLLCDGSVRSLSKFGESDNVKAMTTINGAEQPTPDEGFDPSEQ